MTPEDVDVAVIGAGPAGLAAARASASAGAGTVLLDANPRPGGQYYRQPGRTGVAPTRSQREGQALFEDAVEAGAEPRLGVSVWSATHRYGRVELDTHSAKGDRGRVRARCTVVAVGAHERFVPIPGWTLPGVFSAGGVQTFLKEQGIPVGSRVVLGGTGPLQLVVAAELARHGVDVPALFELARPVSHALRHPTAVLTGAWGQWARMSEGAHAAITLARTHCPVRVGWTITEVLGSTRVEGIRAAPVDSGDQPITARAIEIDCDAVALHHSLVPNTELLRLLGVELQLQPGTGHWVPRRTTDLETSADNVFAAGDGSGIGGLALSLVEGAIAGQSAAAKALAQPTRITRTMAVRLRREQRFQRLYAELFRIPDALVTALSTPETTVCRCEGVTAGDLDCAIAQGAATSYLAKAVTRAGMGPCQGRLCAPTVDARLRSSGAEPRPLSRAVRAPLTALPMRALTKDIQPDD